MLLQHVAGCDASLHEHLRHMHGDDRAPVAQGRNVRQEVRHLVHRHVLDGPQRPRPAAGLPGGRLPGARPPRRATRIVTSRGREAAAAQVGGTGRRVARIVEHGEQVGGSGR